MTANVRPRVAYFEPDDPIGYRVKQLLEHDGYLVHRFREADTFLRAAEGSPFALLLLPPVEGRPDRSPLIAELRKRAPDKPIARVPCQTARCSPDTPAPQLRPERQPVDIGTLRALLERQLIVGSIPTAFDGPPPHSAPLRAALALATRAGASDSSLLVTGETGVGKEVVARWVHASSNRSQRPFVAINCAALAPGVLESEVFGHVQGAFSGALRNHRGLFQQAAGGTVLLDEIGDAPLEFQTKLLRVLQDHVVRPVGTEQDMPVDVRVIASTNRDLEEEIQAGRFRRDLYDRLAGVPIHVAPLRERRADILPLAHHFLPRFSALLSRTDLRFAPRAAEWLLAQPCPGATKRRSSTRTRHSTPSGAPSRPTSCPRRSSGPRATAQRRRGSSGSIA